MTRRLFTFTEKEKCPKANKITCQNEVRQFSVLFWVLRECVILMLTIIQYCANFISRGLRWIVQGTKKMQPWKTLEVKGLEKCHRQLQANKK